MQTSNHYFSSDQALARYLTRQGIIDSASLLIQVYSSHADKTLIQSCLDALACRLPGATVIGATSAGEMADGQVSQERILLTFSQFDNTRLSSTLQPLTASNFQDGLQLAKDLVTEDTRCLLVFADGLACNGEELLKGIQQQAPNVTVAGGLAGDMWRFAETRVYWGTERRCGHLVAVALDSDVLQVSTRYFFGWRPVGKLMTVTQANDNRVVSIDHKPVREIYRHYLKLEDNYSLHTVGEFPLVIQRDGEIIAREPICEHSDGSVSFAGNFKAGDQVQFAYADVPAIRMAIPEAWQELSDLPVESLFVFSCAARRQFFGELVNDELQQLNQLATTSGFFCYGEFFHHQGNNEFLNQTLTLLLLSETGQTPPKRQIPAHSQPKRHRSINQLLNLVEVTSQELSGLNEKLQLNVIDKTNQLKLQLFVDPSSGLPNRAQLLSDLAGESDFFPEYLAIANVDHFHAINDFYGSVCGDLVLAEIGSRLEAMIPAGDRAYYQLYRLPSDEFAIAANCRISFESFYQVIERHAEVICNRVIPINGDQFNVDLSVGLAARQQADLAHQQHPALLSAAGLALKEAKRKHLRTVNYSGRLSVIEELQKNLEWTRRLKFAIAHGQLQTWVQPIKSLTPNGVDKYEALVRLRDSDGTIVGPMAFLDVARRTQLYHGITRLMVENACRRFADSRHPFSINIGLADIKNRHTVAHLKEQIIRYGVGDRLIIEILESEGIEAFPLVDRFFREMRALGCQIAIDDFGSGYSNFAYLMKISPEFIKIDGSLIRDIDEDATAYQVVATICEFARKIGSRITAEFVHSQAVLDKVRALGIDFAQGYHLGKPHPIEELERVGC